VSQKLDHPVFTRAMLSHGRVLPQYDVRLSVRLV